MSVQCISLSIVDKAARIEAVVDLGLKISDPKIVANSPEYDEATARRVSDERRRMIKRWQQKDENFAASAAQWGFDGLTYV